MDEVWAVREGTLSGISPDPWEVGEVALRRLFGSDDPGHSLHAAPHGWLSLIETQVTGGLAHFLTTGAAAVRRRRVAALFAACGVSFDHNSIGRIGAVAEAPVRDGGRLDLVAFARSTTGADHLLVLEGKLGTELSPGQLSRYRRAVTDLVKQYRLSLATTDGILVLVGNKKSNKSAAGLRKNKSWQFTTWRDLVSTLDRHLGDADDDDFRRFRRTIWEQCV